MNGSNDFVAFAKRRLVDWIERRWSPVAVASEAVVDRYFDAAETSLRNAYSDASEARIEEREFEDVVTSSRHAIPSDLLESAGLSASDIERFEIGFLDEIIGIGLDRLNPTPEVSFRGPTRSIGELETSAPGEASRSISDGEGASRGLGRGAGSGSGSGAGAVHERDTSPAPESIPAILSAEAPGQVVVGEAAELRVRIERSGDSADPLMKALEAEISSQTNILVMTSVRGGSLEIVEQNMKPMAPPGDQASTESFELLATAPGTSTIEVMFVQGSQPIGSLKFSVEAVAERTHEEPAQAQGSALPVDPAFSDTMFLFVTESRKDAGTTYSYSVTAPALGLAHAIYTKEIKRDAEAFIKRLHHELVSQIRAQSETDVNKFLRDVESNGKKISKSLLPDDMILELWGQRENIGNVLLGTDEEFPMPWELLRMVHPGDSTAVDDRYLAEYGVVRQLGHKVRNTNLGGSRWGYMFADYPYESYPPTDYGRTYFEETLRQAPDVEVEAMDSDPMKLVDDMVNGKYDVIHLGCHGECELDNADDTWLIVGDRRVRRDTPDGPQVGVEPVKLRPMDIDGIDLSERAPIVVLNACESGRRAPGMTGLEGWPDVFLDAGASAFVGTSWSVKGEAAEAFATTLYDKLRAGDTLADAANGARTAARDAKNDASWLAYSVYGYPTARLSTTG